MNIQNEAILNSSLMNVDDELHNLFKQNFKNTFFNKKEALGRASC